MFNIIVSLFIILRHFKKKSVNLSFHHDKKNVYIQYIRIVSSSIHIQVFFFLRHFRMSFFFRRRSIWHASINKSKAALLGFSDAHSERKRRKDIVRVNWGGDRDLLKIAFSVRKSLEWVSLIKQNFLG